MANIPHAIAVETMHQSKMKTDTPGGLESLVLAVTDDAELAAKMRTEMQIQQKLAALAAE